MDTRLPKFIQEAHRLDPSLASNMIDSPEDKQGQRWPITTRPATLSDLPSITNIALTSSSTEPSFAWKFPQHKQFPQDVYNHIRHEYRTYLESVDWVVVVGEVPAVYANGMRSRREEVEEVEMMTIAVAVWNISALPPPDEEYVAQMSENCAEKAQENQQSSSYLPPFNRASNPNRIYAWKNILAQARNYYFLEPCGPYIHLQHVGTHPQYLRQGAGAAVTRWGLELAERWKLRVGVFAGPMGALLCEGLGFEDVAELEVREGEGKRGVELLVMIWGLEGSRVESSGC